MECIACKNEKAENEFPAPEAVVKICEACCKLVLNHVRTTCTKCDRHDGVVLGGGICVRCMCAKK